jgi:hypothetical protein
MLSPSLKGLLVHIADDLLFLSDAPLFRFTLNTSYDHAFHLSRRFSMSPHNYECLLIAIFIAIAVSVANAAAVSSAATFS